MKLTKSQVTMLRGIFSNNINPRNMRNLHVLIHEFGLDYEQIDALIALSDFLADHELEYLLFGYGDGIQDDTHEKF